MEVRENFPGIFISSFFGKNAVPLLYDNRCGFIMETNVQLELAYNFLQYTGVNVFLTGKAGTGKTTFLHRLKRLSPKRMIVLAPTGVAAINAGGVTIHSFFQLPFGPYRAPLTNELPETKERFTNKFSKEKIDIIRSLDLLVIDEISMVRADLLDAVHDVLCRYRDKTRPFGGVQLLMIGDLQQLAPIVKEEEWSLLRTYYKSPFFFNSLALQQTSYVSIELTQVYRQCDGEFIRLLNAIRGNCADQTVFDLLNRRYIPGFKPGKEEGYITLTTHNAQAQLINSRELEEIPASAYSFLAEVKDNFPAYAFPTEECLVLKKGAQVLFVKNDSSPEKRYYNGKIGKITEIGAERIRVKCADDRKEIEVGKEEWTNTKYTIDPETKEITETIEGVFRQYPLKTAWAITIHKSQGLTFERAIIDAGAAFTHGQVYVALSRCKTLEGLVLSSPLKNNVLISDRTVESFTERVEKSQPDAIDLEKARLQYYTELVTDLFDFMLLWKRLQRVAWVFGEHLGKLYPEWTARYRQARENCFSEIVSVGEKFKIQLTRLIAASENAEQDKRIRERISKGVIYFSEKLQTIVLDLLENSVLEIDNKEVRKIAEEALGRLQQEAAVKQETLTAAENGFSVKSYLAARSRAMLEKPRIKMRKSTDKIDISADIGHPELYNRLRHWRKEEADRLKLPVYTIMQQKALLGVANTLPTSGKELLKIPGIGKKVMEKYGKKLLEIVDEFRWGINEPE